LLLSVRRERRRKRFDAHVADALAEEHGLVARRCHPIDLVVAKSQ
jgi:hypothetical protein